MSLVDLCLQSDRPLDKVVLSDRNARLTRGAVLLQVAHYAKLLKTAGVTHQDRVAILMPKSASAVCAMLACMRLGVIAVPLDVRTPDLRRAAILEHIDPALVLTEDMLPEDMLPKHILPGADVRSAAPDANHADGHFETSVLEMASPTDRDVAIILMSSGSTGRPKAIQITHGNLTAFVTWAMAEFKPRPDDIFLSVAPLHFDLCSFDIFVSQAVGAHVHLLSEEEAAFPATVVTAVRSEAATILYTVPTVYQMVARLRAADMPSLRWVLFAGEPMPLDTLRKLRALVLPSTGFANLYGPTETNVVTSHIVTQSDLSPDKERLPIGRPCTDTHVWIGDENGLPVADGEIGEICVQGPTVTPGYWQDPDKTKSLFLPDAPECLRTGDLGWQTPDGLFYLAGRKDRHVKLRGMLVNLAELEAVMAQSSDVAAVAAVLHPKDGLRAALKTHVVLHPDATATALDLTRFVLQRLPKYYAPGQVTFWPSLPTTLNGKIDYTELLRLEQEKE